MQFVKQLSRYSTSVRRKTCTLLSMKVESVRLMSCGSRMSCCCPADSWTITALMELAHYMTRTRRCTSWNTTVPLRTTPWTNSIRERCIDLEIYFFGDPAAHVAPNHALAAQYFRQAAEAGDALAQANYAMLLANGMGVDRDIPQALVFFHRAARQNEAFAFHGLGVMYFTGNGVPQNVTLALEYFEKAIARGYAESHSFLGSAYLHGDGGVPIDHELAFSHFQAAVDGTDGQSSQALFNLGVMHFQGIGTPRSCSTAMPLFRSVALHPDLYQAFRFRWSRHTSATRRATICAPICTTG